LIKNGAARNECTISKKSGALRPSCGARQESQRSL
jgi:hypothetical protein